MKEAEVEPTGAPEKMAENLDDLTPMMEQYHGLCKEYDDCLVLFQVGDFYETFCEAAEVTSRVLEITLTQREDSSGEYPMAGIPIKSADSYIEGLLDEGFRVAVADQVQDPDDATGVVDRAVTRVVTPGTLVEDELLAADDNNYIACLVGDEPYAVSFMDVSTGEFLVTSTDSDEVLSDEIERFSPSEAVVSPDLRRENPDSDSYFGDDCMLTPYDDEVFESANARAEVAEYFRNPDTLLDNDAEVRAAGALLSYAEYTRGTDEDDEEDVLDYVNRLTRYDPRDYMLLDSVALRSLEIFESRGAEGGDTLIDVVDETSSAIGSRKLKKWIRQPLIDPEGIESRLDAVEELERLTLVREEVRDYLRDVYDIERLITRVSRGRANARDLLSLKQTLDVVPDIKETLADADSERLRELHGALDEMEEVRGLIGRAISDDPPIEVTEGGVIKRGFDDELDELRETEREGREWVSNLEEEERERTGIDSLKVGFNKVHGYYIEVTNPNLDDVPDDYQRRQTLKNSERFYTPELKEREDEILGAEERADKLEYELFKEVRDEVAEESERVQALAEALAELDVLACFAGIAVENGYSRPDISDSRAKVDIEAGRHPVVEKGSDFVPNDASLGGESDDTFAVITGPNMSGKSTYMRQVALTVVLAQAGCFVPADGAEVGIFDRVFTRVGASDDIAGGRSTFMVEMVELTRILHSATEDSLVLLDEVGRGTSTTDGLSIAWAVTEFIHDEVGAKTLFATHYHELTRIADELDGVFNLSFAADREEDEDEMVFLHEVVEEASSESYGVEVARMAGVPDSVVERAEELIHDGAFSDGSVTSDVGDGGAEAEKTNGHDSTVRITDFSGNGDENGGSDASNIFEESETGSSGSTETSFDTGVDTDTDTATDVLNEIRETDTANITPVEALNRLNSLKKKLDDTETETDKEA